MSRPVMRGNWLISLIHLPVIRGVSRSTAPLAADMSSNSKRAASSKVSRKNWSRYAT